MTKKIITNLYATVGLFVAVFALLAYSFSSAEWTSAPANAPQNNTEAPINISDQTQVKAGNFGAHILATATTTGAGVWAKEYCDEYGENCFKASDVVGSYRTYVFSTSEIYEAVKSVAQNPNEYSGAWAVMANPPSAPDNGLQVCKLLGGSDVRFLEGTFWDYDSENNNGGARYIDGVWTIIGANNYNNMFNTITCEIQGAVYGWVVTNWGSCSAICPTTQGTKNRTVSCKNRETDETVSDSSCNPTLKPTTSQACSTYCFAPPDR